MPTRSVLLSCVHTPYLHLMAYALPDVQFFALPTPHAPTGWRDDQRPIPPNVHVVNRPCVTDVVLAQTADDLHRFTGTTHYLSHNRQEFEVVSGATLRQWNIPLICISEMKAASWRDSGYDDSIRVILPGIPPEWYGGWTGEIPRILTVANNLRRPLFDLDWWLAVTRDLPVTLVGEGNDGLPGAVGPAKSWDELKGYYRSHRVYVYPYKQGVEDSHNLSCMEASMTGMNVVMPTGRGERAFIEWHLAGRTYPHITNAAHVPQPFDRFAQQWGQVLGV